MRKIRLISRFMAPQPEKKIVAVGILPKISRSKGDQAKKLGQ